MLIPPGQAPAVAAWDEDRLSYRATGQRCERFSASGTLALGALLRLGGCAWQVLASPGHDPDSVMLFDTIGGVLLSADALWELDRRAAGGAAGPWGRALPRRLGARPLRG